jgi:hypothetical protein
LPWISDGSKDKKNRKPNSVAVKHSVARKDQVDQKKNQYQKRGYLQGMVFHFILPLSMSSAVTASGSAARLLLY